MDIKGKALHYQKVRLRSILKKGKATIVNLNHKNKYPINKYIEVVCTVCVKYYFRG